MRAWASSVAWSTWRSVRCRNLGFRCVPVMGKRAREGGWRGLEVLELPTDFPQGILYLVNVIK